MGKWLTYILFFVLPQIAFSQAGGISGRVLTKDSTVIKHIEIELSGKSRAKAITDNEGKFTFKFIPPGEYMLCIYKAYSTRYIGVLVNPDRNNDLHNLIFNEKKDDTFYYKPPPFDNKKAIIDEELIHVRDTAH